MKNKFIVVVSLILALVVGSVSAASDNIIFNPDFESGIPDYLSVTCVGGGNVSASDGKLLLTGGGSKKSAARVELPETELDIPTILAFYFETNGSEAENVVGFIADGSTKPFMTVVGNKLCIENDEFELDSSDEHYAVVHKSDLSLSVWIDGVRLYNDAADMLQGNGSLYFSTTSPKNVDAEFVLRDISVFSEDEYALDGDLIRNNKVSSGLLSECYIDFNIPLVKSPVVTLTSETDSERVLNFDFKKSAIVLEDIILEPQMSYSLKISGIESVYGVHEDEVLSFSTVPSDYIAPVVTVDGLESAYRTGNIMTAEVSVDIDTDIVSTAMFADGVKKAEISGTGIIEYELIQSGEFDIVFEVYDGISRVKSPVFKVVVTENTAPQIETLSFSEGSTLDIGDIRVRISDDFGISDAQLLIDGVCAELVSTEDGIYTFASDKTILGDAQIKIVAVDFDGLSTESVYDVRLVKSRYTQIGDIVDYDNVSTGVDVWVHGRYVKETKSLSDTSNPTKVMVLSYPESVSGSTPYATKAVGNSGIYRFSCDIFLNNLTAMEWMIRGSGSEYVETAIMSGGKITAGGKSKQLETGKWYRIVFGVDTISQTYEFSVDGEMLTPVGGYPLAEPLNSPKITDLRINMKFGVGHSAAFDNWKLERLDSVPDITEVNFDDYKTLRLKLNGITQSDIPDIDKNARSFILKANDETIVPVLSRYNSETSEIILEFDKSLHSACDYELSFDASIVDVNGVSEGEKIRRLFRTPRKDVEILDFEFIRSADGIGAKATLSNEQPYDSASAIMVLSVMDENGEVISVRATPMVVALSGEDKQLYLECESTNGAQAEVLFINNWSEFVAIKGSVNKIKLK